MFGSSSNAVGRRRGEAFVPQPTSMVYAPPNRIMVRVPTLVNKERIKRLGSPRLGSARTFQVQRTGTTVKVIAAPPPPSLLPSKPVQDPLSSAAAASSFLKNTTTPTQQQTPPTHHAQGSRKLPAGTSSAKKGGRMVAHETNVTVTMDTAVPWFAVNVPRAASARATHTNGGASHATLCQHSLTSHDVYGGRVRGWVEPSPDNIAIVEYGGTTTNSGAGSKFSTTATTVEGPPVTDAHGSMRSPLAISTSARRVAPRSLLTLPVVVLQKCFEYLPPTCVDGAVVHVCLRCYHAVRSSPALTKLRFEFVVPSSSHNSSPLSPCDETPSWGVLRYLATRRVGPTPAEQVLQQKPYLAATSDDATLANPCYRPNPCVLVVVAAPPRAEASNSALPQGPLSPSSYLPSPPRALRCVAYSAVTARASSSGNHGGLAPNEHFTSWGPSRFFTPSIPHPWVGIEFVQGYAVEVTGYAFCISSGSSAFPTAWELQGCSVASAPTVPETPSSAVWTETAERWRVLHKMESHHHNSNDNNRSHAGHSSPKEGVVSPFETGCRVATFHVRPHRWGPMNRLRVVQTRRNSQWGHELPISGFEVYGSLSKR
ncbi:unnamed protein product [Bodo saltans]|uniref:Uncharacterized protein n=1 Tax=Bodo saltans TaxID=75058 RepID=A0A0S4J4U3_BODSA|nr:unnamed protein product [Bodo saltans]|eukprot:CUG86226.1 unnamed protein product [Bodo saltans]